MKHLGDITKISGYTAPIVDCIIGGSPCQDLSVAGKRAGLDGERSGLYMEQIRIVREMRARDELNGRTGVDIRPRYMVWENVFGAFSSNKSEDFRIVLEELAKIADKDAVIPQPPKGKWTTCGCVMGDGWSIAWRVLDAQFWGVPQRRRRIALVADFGGQSAPEILLVRKSVSGHSESGESKRKEAASNTSRSIGADDSKCVTFEPGIASREGGHIYENVSGTLRANAGDNQMSVAYTMQDREGCAGGGKGALIQEEKSASLRTNNFQYVFQPVYSVENHPNDSRVGINENGKVQALTGRMGTGGGNVPMVLALDRASFNQGKAVCYGVDAYNQSVTGSVAKTLNSIATDSDHIPCVCKRYGTRYIVRRLTPLECERLQGYTDGWTDIGEWIDSKGKRQKTSDAVRYKALGNSIALPPWKWVLKRLCACYERDATMASLFDGIGGFPYLWEQINGKGSCLWASEIEEFPIAVTKVRIGDSHGRSSVD